MKLRRIADALSSPTFNSRSSTNGHDALDEKLTRLSQKQGVKATVVLDRASGAILRTTGQLSTLNAAAAALAGSGQGSAAAAPGGEGQALDGFAAKVWAWVNASGSLVEELDAEVSRATTHVPDRTLEREGERENPC
ncbi:uncharacterized protein VDAG_01761 [Verticillium dahliae VdLs.17]|uniref:Roadblock/LAMTOR2 domain-containing protein n=1 Tax=Verticillium dahliae (strain VdLs.17 / ATCC MYA-4575 / FGSC 10137) TaxID=498257 RepID=G2WVX5_VERDV|nr:uncharacterized protein VDAG_01761 [Verticillium dahliae VdLs.17]EGY19745.1 hypothetical protein VDAG_01761 [Verticillium dahliae VdLs.17]